MGFTNKDILEVIIMLVTISIGVGKLETLIIDMKWLKETMKEIKIDIKELKSK